MPHSRIGRFLLLSVGWLVVLIVPWYYASVYLAAPVAALASNAMQLLFGWVVGVERSDAIVTLLTRLNVFVSQGATTAVAQLAPEVNFRTFGYGSVLLWALLLASRPEGLWRKLLLGSAVLMPFQALGLCFQWLRDVAIGSDPQVLEQTRMAHWALEVIAYGYQFGFLILTPLAPALVWLLLDRRFVTALWVEMSLAGAMERGKT